MQIAEHLSGLDIPNTDDHLLSKRQNGKIDVLVMTMNALDTNTVSLQDRSVKLCDV